MDKALEGSGKASSSTHMQRALLKSFDVSRVASPARSWSSAPLKHFAATLASTGRDASAA
jgi:hypothetical protein